MSKPHADYGLAKSQKDLTVDKSACLPAGYAMNSLPVGSPQASLTRIAAKKEPDGILTYITLSAYTHGQAQSAMTGLSAAVKSCADGFTAKGPGSKNPYKTVRSEPSPAGGDEALAFAACASTTPTVTPRPSGRRSSASAIWWSRTSPSTARPSSSGPPATPRSRAAVVRAQNAKLA
ncbi:hypothetical protein ACQ4WX_28485 [Streptomyces lasalocidi]